MSEFKEKNDLIQEFLKREGLDFKKGMSRKEREAFNVERQSLVLRVGLNQMSVKELKHFLGKHDVIIYMRDIKLDVVIPKDFVWEFILAFGEEFTVEDTHLGKAFKTIDDYYDHPNGWHIKLSVYEKDENRFYAFLEEFCKKRDLLFRDPRTEEK